MQIQVYDLDRTKDITLPLRPDALDGISYPGAEDVLTKAYEAGVDLESIVIDVYNQLRDLGWEHAHWSENGDTATINLEV